MTETTPARASGLQPTTVDEARIVARDAASSGLFAVRRPEEALVILLTGRELGLGAMASLRGIYVVSGRPVLSADLMVAAVRRSGLCRSWRTVESTPERCTVETLRVGEEHPASKTWTSADARRAGLGGKGVWQQYPAQMLRHRCAADLAREVYPDVILGLYTPEEMDAAEALPAESVPVERVEAPPDPRTIPTEPAPAPERTPLEAWRSKLERANGRLRALAPLAASLTGDSAPELQRVYLETLAARVAELPTATALYSVERWAEGAPEALTGHPAWAGVLAAIEARRTELTAREPGEEG